MSDIEKPCVICGQSCAGKPRIKDAQGRYAHKACAQKAQQNPTQPEPDPLDLSPEEEPDMAAFLDDLPTSQDTDPSAGIRAACPGCGASISSDAIVCMSCGCNTKTGRGSKTKVAKLHANNAGPNLATKAGSLAITPFLPILGAVLGGAIGAAIWAAVVYITGFEIGYVAIGVGAITGIGASVATGGNGNTWSGFVAVVVALFAILTGKAIVNSIYLDQLEEVRQRVQSQMEEEITLDAYTPDDAIWDFADEIIFEHQDNHKKIHWPDPEMTYEEALWPDDYPKNIILQATNKWEALTPEAQLDIRQSQIDDMQQYADSFNDLIDEEITTNTNLIDTLTLFDALWIFLALGAAWSVGSGASDDD